MLKRTFWLSMLGVGLLAFTAPSAFAAATTSADAGKVVMYATQSCGYCAKARSYFDQHGIAFEERDIEKSPAAHAEWKSLGGIGTPLIVIDGERFQGYDESRLDAALAKRS
jgi:glutaredoxin